jgi:hypothetical protein
LNFIIAGQSNAIGRDSISNATIPLQKLQAVKIVNSVPQSIYTPTNYGTDRSGDYGVEYKISDNLSECIFLKYAVGGTSIGANGGGSWATNGASTASLIAAYNTVSNWFIPLAMVWIQGENDAVDATDAANYQTNLTNLIAHFRTNINADLKMIIVRLYDFPTTSINVGKADVQAAQDYIAANVSNCVLVHPEDDCGITSGDVLGDNIHYKASGIEKIGNYISNIL